MPAEAIHLTSLREGLACAPLPTAVRRSLARAEPTARLGALFPDLPYFAAFGRELARYVVGLPPRPSPWGARTHDDPVPVLCAFVARANRRRGEDADVSVEDARAFAVGLASHLAIDRAMHPLVNWLADRDVRERGGLHAAAHREVEKFHSICFHEAYLGDDMMGTRTLRGYLFVAGIDRLARSPVAEMARRAFADVHDGAPSARELSAWGRSYVHYTHVLASPLGARVAPPAAKEAARPRYQRGEWGTFEGELDRAITRSGAVLGRVAELVEGHGRDQTADEVGRALDGLLGGGTIDPPGSAFRPAAPSA